MGLYTRPQIVLLLGLVVVAGLGLAIGQWRRTHPDVAAQLEAFDQRVDPAAVNAAAPPSSTGASPDPVPPVAGQRTSRDPASSGRSSLKGRGALATDAAPVDLNRATVEDLMRLPGVGPVLANRIVSARESDGPFASVDDLRRVSGVGPTRIERFRPLVTISP